MAAIRPEDLALYGGRPEDVEAYREGFAPRLEAALDEELTEHRNPAGGPEEVYLRRRHNRIRSPRLAAMLECVGEHTRGRRFRGMGAAADERAVHQALAEASRECSRLTAR
jgi:hypothetical protein